MPRRFFSAVALALAAAAATIPLPAVAGHARAEDSTSQAGAQSNPRAGDNAGKARPDQVPEPAQRIDQESLLQRIATRDPDLVILDVRTPEEYSSGHIAGAINIAYDQLPDRAAELEAVKDKDIVLYCRSGRRTAIAADTLHAQGFERLWHLDGDMLAWEAAKRPVVKGGSAEPGAPEPDAPN